MSLCLSELMRCGLLLDEPVAGEALAMAQQKAGQRELHKALRSQTPLQTILALNATHCWRTDAGWMPDRPQLAPGWLPNGFRTCPG